MHHIVYEVTASGTMLPFGDTVLTAVLGYGVVFLGLLMLMVIVHLMGAIFRAKKRTLPAPAPTAVLPENTPLPLVQAAQAPGSAGAVKRFDVPDREAALLMAIVADQMGKPLNELRFQSIKEVKEDEI